MRKLFIGAAALAALAWSLPATAQDSSIKAGSFWQANRIYVEDGHFENYMDWLTKTWGAIRSSPNHRAGCLNITF